MGAKHDLVAALETAARLACLEDDRFSAVPPKREQTAEARAIGAAEAGAAEQVAGLEIAAVGAVVRRHLRCRPMEIETGAKRESHWSKSLASRLRGFDQDFGAMLKAPFA